MHNSQLYCEDSNSPKPDTRFRHRIATYSSKKFGEVVRQDFEKCDLSSLSVKRSRSFEGMLRLSLEETAKQHHIPR